MQSLSIELKRLCVEFLEENDREVDRYDKNDHSEAFEALKALRLVNHEIGSLATEVLFRTAVLERRDDSREKLAALIQSKYCRSVKCVVIKDFDYDDFEVDDPGEELEVTETYTRALTSLCSFPNLQELCLEFDKACAADPDWDAEVNQTITYRSAILSTIFKAVEGLKTLKVLSIKNLQDYMDRQILDSEVFRSLRSRLTGLHLQITTEYLEQHSLEFAAIHRGFTIDLPELWLKPVLPHLTHLTLYSYTCMWGLYPFVDFREVGTFPCLQSLSFGNWTIAHDWQIDWILSHGPTLKQLLLDDCFIIAALRMADDDDMAKLNFPDLKIDNAGGNYHKLISLRWHQVLDLFRISLTHLEHFALRSSEFADNPWDVDNFDRRYKLVNESNFDNDSYYVYNCGIVPCWLDLPGVVKNSRQDQKDWIEFTGGGQDDTEALGRLMDVVNKRGRKTV